MPDRKREDLERELREIGRRVQYPPTPDLARSVRRRLDAESARGRAGDGGRRSGGPRRFFTPGWAAAAAAIVLVSLAVLSPAVRSTSSGSALSGGAGGGAGQAAGGAGSDASSAPSAEYAAGTTSPTGGATDGSAASSSRPSSVLGLGRDIPVSEARDRVGNLLLPQAPELAGEPRVTYGTSTPSGEDGVVVVYGPGRGLPPLGGSDAGLIIFEVPGDAEAAYPAFGRASGPREEVEVGGRRGYWLPDAASLPLPVADGDATLTGGALIWEQGDLALLLRADVTREDAVRIAETVR